MTLPSDNMSTKVQQLVNLLVSHDWYYDYSDDAKMWQRGNQSEKKMLDLVKELGDYGRDIFNVYAPEGFKLKREA